MMANSVQNIDPALSDVELQKLKAQESRGLLSAFQQMKLEKESGRNWDKFYKRNENRFFKDRHWTTREFIDLVGNDNKEKTLFEIGCGVGNFFYPLLEENANFYIHACDVSKRAIDLVKQHSQYDVTKINAFVCDITEENFSVNPNSVDLCSLIFVLSAILPRYFQAVLTKIFEVLKPGSLLLFRDYGVNDMAMIRFGPGSKLAEKLYVRQDGTMAYYFSRDELSTLMKSVGFEVITNEYIIRRTVNKKEHVDARRVFLQAKCRKPNTVIGDSSEF